MTRKVKSRAKPVDALLETKRATAITPEVLPAAAPTVQNAASSAQTPLRVENGLAEAIGFGGGAQGVTTEPASDPSTIFDSLRWFLVTNFRQILSEAYGEIGIVQTLVDVPVDDALRGGIEIKSQQLSEDQIEELKNFFEGSDLEHAGQAAKWNRLFGGAGVIVVTDQDPETPLDLEAIGPDTPLEFKSADLWELNWDRYDESFAYDTSAQIAEPLEDRDDACFNYYGVRVHKSRVLRLTGIQAPSYLRPRLRGWGVSCVEILVRSINQYIKATSLAFEVLDEFKLDVFKIKNLTSTLLSPNGTQAVAKRVQLAAWQKNYQNAMVMDSEDDFDHKQLSFSGLAEAMLGIKQQVAADTRFPMTKLFGISAAGFNSGEDDIEVYNSMVESQVRQRLKRDLLRMVELRSQQRFGFIPDDLTVHFKPLRVLSAVDEENVKTQKYNRLMAAKTAGLITDKEFRDAVNKGNLFDVTLKTDDSAIDEAEAEKAAKQPMGGEGGGEEKPTPKTSPTDATGGKAKPAGSPAA